MDEVRSRAESALAALDVTALRDRPTHLLSYGQRKRAAIAGAVAPPAHPGPRIPGGPGHLGPGFVAMRIFEATIDPRSLRWDGDELVDAAGGFRRWTADGKELAGTWNTAYRFDRAAHSPTGRVARGVGAAPGRAFGVEHIPSPVTALHPDGSRLAVAVGNGVAVLDLPHP